MIALCGKKMAIKPLPPKPTDSELAILHVLWRSGTATVRQVHSELSKEQTTGYTTVLKTMQIMAEKGLVVRDESQKTHIYSPAISEQQAQKRFVQDLLDKVFNGSARNLVLRALSTKKASEADMKEIRNLLNELEGGKK